MKIESVRDLEVYKLAFTCAADTFCFPSSQPPNFPSS